MKAPVRMLKTQAGFSLIELMIVVAIIGILASIAVPNFQKFQRRAKQSEGKGYLSSIFSAEQGFRAEWNEYNPDLVCIGFKDTTIAAPADGIQGRGNYRAGFSGVTGVATAGTTCAATAANYIAAPQPAGGVTIAAATTGAAFAGGTGGSFTAAVDGSLGGALNDQWTINNLKVLNNTQSGL